MRQESYPLEVKTVAASGEAQPCRDLVNKTVWMLSPDGDYRVELSPDEGSTWVEESSFTTTDARVVIDAEATHVRIRTVTHNSGTPVAILLAKQARSD